MKQFDLKDSLQYIKDLYEVTLYYSLLIIGDKEIFPTSMYIK